MPQDDEAWAQKDPPSASVPFLHLKSLTDPRGFGLRDDQTERALKFRNVLNNASPDEQANYISHPNCGPSRHGRAADAYARPSLSNQARLLQPGAS